MQNQPDPHAAPGDQIPTAGVDFAQPKVGRVPPGMDGVAAAYLSRVQASANWFYWIAGLSLLNSIIVLAVNGRWSFLVGLGVTQFIDGLSIGLSEQVGSATMVIALVLDLIVAGLFVGFGLLARKPHTWAFILGMVIYALDGLIFLYFQVWLSFAFHIYVLYRLYQGIAASNKLKALQAEAATMMH